MQKIFTQDDVTIRDTSPKRVAIIEHRGDPATIGTTIQRLIDWRKAAGLSHMTNPTFNVSHSDPRTTAPAKYRTDLCVGTDQPIEANGERIEAGTIPGGRCAVLRVIGNTDNLEPAALYLYRNWLPASGEDRRRERGGVASGTIEDSIVMPANRIGLLASERMMTIIIDTRRGDDSTGSNSPRCASDQS